jgi:predicted transcriptional regulator
MPNVATSIKLPEELKARVEAAAEAAGKTTHAFMLEAIERETARAERYEAFLDEALQAEREMEHTGLHYVAEDVFRYMSARAQGKTARRPKPKSWRK